MIISHKVSSEEVYKHWSKIDNQVYENFISSSNGWYENLEKHSPNWHKCTLEKKDINNLYIIHAPDWLKQEFFSREEPDLSLRAVHETFIKKIKSNYKVENSIPSENNKVLKINNIIQELKKDRNSIERKLIIVACNKSGPFTIIDGNHRAIAFFDHKLLIGNEIYLGVSPEINNLDWVKKC